MQDKIASQQRSVLGTCQGLLQVIPVNLGRSSLRYNGGSELHRGIMRAKVQRLRRHFVTIQSCLESRLLVGRCQVTGVKPSRSVLISICLSVARASCELREQLWATASSFTLYPTFRSLMAQTAYSVAR